jgi:hypothetical protein
MATSSAKRSRCDVDDVYNDWDMLGAETEDDINDSPGIRIQGDGIAGIAELARSEFEKISKPITEFTFIEWFLKFHHEGGSMLLSTSSSSKPNPIRGSKQQANEPRERIDEIDWKDFT